MKYNVFKHHKIALCALSSLTLAACGGGGGGDDSAAPTSSGNSAAPTIVTSSTYTIGGSVSGVTANGLILQNNAGDDLAISPNSSSFTFANKVANGNPYKVTIKSQPAGLACAVVNNSGTANANVNNVQVECAAGQYVRVDGSGKDILPSSNPAVWCAVKDVKTGLMWENHQSVADAQKTYTNYDDTTQGQFYVGLVGNSTTIYRNPTAAEVAASTNSVGYKIFQNAAKLCGFNDWRIPQISNGSIRSTAQGFSNLEDGIATPELDSLKSGVGNPRINITFFQNTQANSKYLSATSFSPFVGRSWYVDFNSDYIGQDFRFNNKSVRLVRTIQ